jgi:hypothetical protein
MKTTVCVRKFQHTTVYTAVYFKKQYYVSLDAVKSLGNIPSDSLQSLSKTIFDVEIYDQRPKNEFEITRSVIQPTPFLLVSDVLKIIDQTSNFGVWLQSL